MIPGIGTLINSFAVIGVGVITRIFVKKEIKNFENNLLPLGLLVLTLGIRESLKSPEFLLTLIAVLIGAIIGTYLKIKQRIKWQRYKKRTSGIFFKINYINWRPKIKKY